MESPYLKISFFTVPFPVSSLCYDLYMLFNHSIIPEREVSLVSFSSRETEIRDVGDPPIALGSACSGARV